VFGLPWPRVAAGLTFALPKGRILDAAVPLLQAAGLDFGPAIAAAGRRLELTSGAHRILLVKPTDVPTYVEHGVADVGIAGRDTLEEQGRDLYEPVDLRVCACRLVVAEPIGAPKLLGRASLRVATKYPRIARRHYLNRGISAQVIPLYGSVELGALTGLADQIVDLVESGETLRQNRLREVETVMEVTSRVVVHPASLKLARETLAPIIDALRAAVAAHFAGRKVATAS
jgi:ATP phosphoribosyltransferase